MRAVLQRVSEARVRVNDAVVGAIGPGLVVLLGIAIGDGETELEQLAAKIVGLRIFENDAGKFDRSLLDVGGGALVVSQFTLLANTKKGRRPSFTDAADPGLAENLYQRFAARLTDLGVVDVATGTFGAHMHVELVNDGPVTLLLESSP